MKFYSTRLTFSDIQRSEYSAKTPAEGAKMEFPEASKKNLSSIDMRKYAKSRSIHQHRDPKKDEFVPKVPDFERG